MNLWSIIAQDAAFLPPVILFRHYPFNVHAKLKFLIEQSFHSQHLCFGPSFTMRACFCLNAHHVTFQLTGRGKETEPWNFPTTGTAEVDSDGPEEGRSLNKSWMFGKNLLEKQMQLIEVCYLIKRELMGHSSIAFRAHFSFFILEGGIYH